MHVGKLINQIRNEKKITRDEFAARINKSSSNTANIFNRESLDIALLTQIGKALDFDFFEVLSNPSILQQRIAEIHNKKFGIDEDELVSSTPEHSSRRVSGTIQVTVELDGSDETLNLWMAKLKAINQAL